MSKNKLLIIGFCIGSGAFVWLCCMDYKIAIAVFLMMFGDNISKAGKG